MLGAACVGSVVCVGSDGELGWLCVVPVTPAGVLADADAAVGVPLDPELASAEPVVGLQAPSRNTVLMAVVATVARRTAERMRNPPRDLAEFAAW